MHLITPLQEKLSEVVTANGDALNAIVGVLLNASEQLFALNMGLARSYSASIAASKTGTFFEQLNAQSGSAVRSLELVGDYLRNVSGICIKSQAEIAQINIERFNELAESLGSLLDTLAKSGPMGSAEMVEQIKLALNRVTEAYENVARTSNEFAEHSLAVADETAQPLIEATSNTARKLPRETLIYSSATTSLAACL